MMLGVSGSLQTSVGRGESCGQVGIGDMISYPTGGCWTLSYLKLGDLFFPLSHFLFWKINSGKYTYNVAISFQSRNEQR